MKLPDILEIPHLNKVTWYMTLCVWPLFSMARQKSLVIVYILRKKEFIWQIISIASIQRLQHHVWNLPHILSKNRTFTSLHSLKCQAPLKKRDESFFLFLCFVFYAMNVILAVIQLTLGEYRSQVSGDFCIETNRVKTTLGWRLTNLLTCFCVCSGE